MRLLLDTCTVSDFSMGDPGVPARIKAASPRDLAVSAITKMEIAYGLLLRPGIARRLKQVLDSLFDAVEMIPYDEAAAEATARIRARLKQQGRPIGAYDALIAGTALANELILVTSNVREFHRVQGLLVENWRL